MAVSMGQNVARRSGESRILHWMRMNSNDIPSGFPR
jgi:hypothetical protein